MTTISACIPGFPFDFREVFLAIFIRFEPIRELQKVLPFKYVHFLLLFDYKYRYLSCDLYNFNLQYIQIQSRAETPLRFAQYDCPYSLVNSLIRATSFSRYGSPLGRKISWNHRSGSSV